MITNLVAVVESSHPSRGAMDLKWSADGNLISFVRNSDILLLFDVTLVVSRIFHC